MWTLHVCLTLPYLASKIISVTVYIMQGTENDQSLDPGEYGLKLDSLVLNKVYLYVGIHPNLLLLCSTTLIYLYHLISVNVPCHQGESYLISINCPCQEDTH